MPRKPKVSLPEEGVEEFSLYSGKVRLLYKDSSHRYRISVDGGKPEQKPSITTILNVLNKPAIAEWACRVCCDYIEENLRLLIAGNSFSVEQVFKIVALGRNAHDRAREEAAEIGTNTHDWLRDYWRSLVRKTDPPVMPEEERTQNCIGGAMKFFKEHEFRPVKIEEAQYSLKHGFCGRPDWIGYIDDEFATLDYKSTRSIYPELCLQLTGYAEMHHEEFGQLPDTRWGLRLDKETGEFEARKYGPETFELDKQTFLACFLIYDRLKHLRRKPKPEGKPDFLEGL